MKIKWYGHAAFRLMPEQGPTIITDPYTPDGVGYPPIEDDADLVITSSNDDDAHCRADLIAGDPTVVNALEVALNDGGVDVHGLDIRAIEAAEWDEHPEHAPGQNGMYRVTLDGIEIAHMGDVGNPLTDRPRNTHWIERFLSYFDDRDVDFACAAEVDLKRSDLPDETRVLVMDYARAGQATNVR